PRAPAATYTPSVPPPPPPSAPHASHGPTPPAAPVPCPTSEVHPSGRLTPATGVTLLFRLWGDSSTSVQHLYAARPCPLMRATIPSPAALSAARVVTPVRKVRLHEHSRQQ